MSPEKRTVTAALRVMGLSDEKPFGKYHRVLSRAVWSSLTLSRILLGLLVTLLLGADSPLPIVIDETLERRPGAKIRAKGVFRDAVRSTQARVVTSFGLRWGLGGDDAGGQTALGQAPLGVAFPDRVGAV